MIDVFETNNTNLVSFRLSGQIGAEDIDVIADILEKKFDSQEFVDLYIEIADDLEESFGGLFEQAKKGFSVILPNLGKLRKAALVSDKTWLHKVTDFKDIFFSMEMKAFKFPEKEIAREWVEI